VLVDPKGRDFRRYRGAGLLTPNLKEFEAVAGPCRDEAELETRARDLCRELELDAMLITRGERGMSLIRSGDSAPLHLATHAHEVFDVTGAGDTVIATLAAALASGETLDGAVTWANLAAGLVVEKLGTASVSAGELNYAATRSGAGRDKILDEARLAAVLEGLRGRGGRLVMTNGCFDVLHAGHVDCLEQARALGDCLIVAVNDDASVARLKGDGRPFNRLQERLAVLSGLAAVDWLIPFTEDTPEALIERIRPDCLVKGGDYRPEQIAGADSVRRHGGEVVILPLREGCSSSRIVRALKGGSGEGRK
jgi:D-beta-D-heptose 7-phosphate kinase/D-beta-D-heptose 1-phosphate adenosyltransferase